MTRVVVGVDGSADADAAASWAAALGGPAGSVRLVRVVEADDPRSSPDVASSPGQADPGGPERSHEVRPGSGDIARDLLDATTTFGGDVVVVGARGAGSGRRLGAGPTTEALVLHGSVPVAVVRDGATPALQPGATVVVGVGYGAATTSALHWVASVAAPLGLRVRLVHAVGLPPLSAEGLTEVLAHVIDPGARRRWVEEDLDDAAAELRRAAGEQVEVDWHAPSGAAGLALLREAEQAALLVVGRHRGVLGERVVPLSTQLLMTRSSCPVVIVPAPDEPPAHGAHATDR